VLTASLRDPAEHSRRAFGDKNVRAAGGGPPPQGLLRGLARAFDLVAADFGASSRYHYTRPTITAPTIGNTMKSHSWLSAQPPTKWARARRLRAGFTDVMSSGMLMRWMRVSARPLASGARPAGRGPPVGDAVDHEQEEEGEQQLDDDRRQHRVPRRGMIAVAVGGEAVGEREPRLAAGDHVEDGSTRAAEDEPERAEELRGGLLACSHV
jgi:hypothetical protein